MASRIIFVVLLLLLTGCAQTSYEPAYYISHEEEEITLPPSLLAK